MTATRRAPPALVALLVFLCFLLPACHRRAGTLYPVHGRVLVAGKPASGALVVLVPVHDPDALHPFGQADDAGAFTLTTRATGDGAPAGEYTVTIEWRRKKSNPFDKEGPDRLQGRYSDPRKSSLHARVEPMPNDLPPFQLP